MAKYPKIPLKVADNWHEEQCFCNGEYAWRVENIWEAAKDLPAYEVPLVGMNFDIAPWDGTGDEFMTYLAHVRLINNADLSYPIILTPDGTIADGRHRLAKALVEGHTTIKVKRLAFMPEPDYEFDENGNEI